MANEKRLIDANALLERLASSSESWAKNLQAIRNWWPHAVGIKDNIVGVIKDMPTVDAVEVVHGRWVDEYPYVRCSECNAEWFNCTTDNEPKVFYYCPNCGAKMDGGDEDV